MSCPCGSNKEYNNCCEPIIRGEALAATPEDVMRARFSAFSKGEIDYLKNSLEPKQHAEFDPEEIQRWSESSEWKSLEIRSTTGGSITDKVGTVEFVARYITDGQEVFHHELAEFTKEGDRWYFVDGQLVSPQPMVREQAKVGRNDPCTCGSGKKFKKCCGKK